MRSSARAVWTTLRIVIGELSQSFNTIQLNTRHQRTRSPVISPRLHPEFGIWARFSNALNESPVHVQRATGARLFQYVVENLLQIVLGSPAEPIGRWHSGAPLYSSSQPCHYRHPVAHPVVRGLTKRLLSESAEVRSGAIE